MRGHLSAMNDGIFLDSSFPLPLGAPFTTAQARREGVNDRRLRELVAQGLLRRPVKGVYVDSRVRDCIELRADILALVVPEDCFVCDRTAGWLHAGASLLAPNEHLAVPPVSIFRPADGGRLRNGLVVSGERTVISSDLMEVRGIRATTPLRTALDLGRLLRRDQALAALDAMLRVGGFTLDQLLAEIERFKGFRGVRQLRALAPLADGRAQSPGESILRLRWYDAGLPRPQLQIEVILDARTVFYLDIGLEELLFAAEYDGERFHSAEADVEYDGTRRNRLAVEAGWQIEVFRKQHVHGRAETTTARLARAFDKARATAGSRGPWI